MYRSISTDRACYILMPAPTTLIVSKRPDGGYNVMTASWVMPLSRRPPLIAVAIAPRRYTYECITKSGEFTVCVLGPEMRDVAMFCGTVSGRDVDKISKLNLRLVNLTKVSTPGIEGSLAIIGCKLWKDYDGGDHRIVVGEVQEILVKEGVFEDTWKNVELLYYYGGEKFITIKIV